MKQTEKLSIMIDLDILLDTRLALIRSLYPNLYNRLVNSKELYNREGNNFTVDKKIFYSGLFEHLYKLRNKNIIKYANPTFMAYLLTHMLDDFTTNYTDDNGKYEFKLFINTYPYLFNEEEIKWLHLFMLNFVPVTTEVDFIYKSIYDLTAEYVTKNKMLELYMYNGFIWLDYIASSKQFLSNKLLNHTLFFPKLYNNKSFINQNTNSFYEEVTNIYSYIIQIDYLEMSSITDYTTAEF